MKEDAGDVRGNERGAFRVPVKTLSTREFLPCHLGVPALPVGSKKSPGFDVFSDHASDHHLICMVNASQLALRRPVSSLSIRIRVRDHLHSTAHYVCAGLAGHPTIVPMLYGLTVGSLFLLDDVSLLRVRFSEQVPLKKIQPAY
jgi:hypothetical protein